MMNIQIKCAFLCVKLKSISSIVPNRLKFIVQNLRPLRCENAIPMGYFTYLDSRVAVGHNPGGRLPWIEYPVVAWELLQSREG